MKTPEQVCWDLVRAWLSKAESDLLAAEQLRDATRREYDIVGFAAQQASEKFLKALLTRHQVEFPKTHDIMELAALAEEKAPGISDELTEADKLTDYAVNMRYPGEAEPMDRERAGWAVALARKVRDFILDAMKEYLEAGRPDVPEGQPEA